MLQKLVEESRSLATEIAEPRKQLAEQRRVNENLEKAQANAIYKSS